jgi:hypothetical protein
MLRVVAKTVRQKLQKRARYLLPSSRRNALCSRRDTRAVLVLE